MRSSLLMILFGGLLLSSAAGQEAADPDVTIDQIVAAWKARHDVVKSFECTIEETIIHPPGRLFGRELRSNDDEGQPFPREELTLHLHHTVSIDGARLRLERTGENWVYQVEKVQPDRLVQLFDGDRYVTFFGTDDLTDEHYPLAFVRPSDRAPTFAGTAFAYWPVFHAFRSQSPQKDFGPYDAAHWRISKKAGSIDGRRCIVLEEIKSADEGLVVEVWVDPEQDFIAVRMIVGITELTIKSERDVSGVWVPREWRYLNYARHEDGRPALLSDSTHRIPEYRLNEPIADAAFELDFPPGTEVNDFTEGGDGRIYLVTEGGERTITREEKLRGARHTDFLETPEGGALSPPVRHRFAWWWAVGAAVCVVAAALWMRRGR